MKKENKIIVGFASSEFARENSDDCVAFRARKDIECTLIRKGDPVFVNMSLPESEPEKDKSDYDIPDIFAVKA